MRRTLIVAASALSVLFAPSVRAAQGPRFSAVVDSAGVLARGLNAAGATHLATGQYEVDFTKKVTLCGYTATIGLPGAAGSSDFGTVNVAKRGGNKKAVFVQTFDVAGNPADLGFHLIVNC